MKQRTPRSLAFDLLATDLRDPDAVAVLVIAHTVAPARAAWGLPAPRPGELDSFLIERTERTADGVVNFMRPCRLDESQNSFVPVLRGLLLFAWLFPASVPVGSGIAALLDEPGWSFLDDSFGLMGRPYDAMNELVRALLGADGVEITEYTGLFPLQPAPNPEAIAALEEAQDLVERAVGPVPRDPSVYVIDRGLDRMEWWTARDLDKIVREHVRRRVVRLESPEFPGGADEEGVARTIYMDRGVFRADIPETIGGLVALDLTEQLGHDRTTGICAGCRGLLALTDRQAGCARRGQPVYHEDCLRQHRLLYWRGKARDRYAQTKRRELLN